MTISSSLNAGVAGLTANASRLATISDNIANSSTYGYKKAYADFHSMVISPGSGTYSAGGVRVTTHRLIDERGPLVSTNNATDLAVRGQGMLPVTTAAEVGVDNGDQQMLLTTTGSFRTDKDGILRTDTGLVLLGWPANADGTMPTYPRDTSDSLEPVQINVNQFGGQPTTTMAIGVNLPATATDSTSDGESQELSVEYFDNLGTSENVTIEFTPTVPTSGSSNQWTMVVRDSASEDAIVGEYIIDFNDDRTSGGGIGNVTTVSGGPYDVTDGSFVIDVAGGPIEIDIGAPGEGSGITQLSDNFAPVSISKDGSPVGNMTSVEIDENGFLHAFFDVGLSRTVYQIPLVDMPNPNSLTPMGQQTFAMSPESGTYFLWDAGDGPTGDIVSYAREESTTDVAGELTQLIQTQRAYSSNAKVIQTVDEMLQETTNIKR